MEYGVKHLVDWRTLAMHWIHSRLYLFRKSQPWLERKQYETSYSPTTGCKAVSYLESWYRTTFLKRVVWVESSCKEKHQFG